MSDKIIYKDKYGKKRIELVKNVATISIVGDFRRDLDSIVVTHVGDEKNTIIEGVKELIEYSE